MLYSRIDRSPLQHRALRENGAVSESEVIRATHQESILYVLRGLSPTAKTPAFPRAAAAAAAEGPKSHDMLLQLNTCSPEGLQAGLVYHPGRNQPLLPERGERDGGGRPLQSCREGNAPSQREERPREAQAKGRKEKAPSQRRRKAAGNASAKGGAVTFMLVMTWQSASLPSGES